MRKRNHVIPVRLNAKELRFLEEQVEKSGLSREEYIRSLVMRSISRMLSSPAIPQPLATWASWLALLHRPDIFRKSSV